MKSNNLLPTYVWMQVYQSKAAFIYKNLWKKKISQGQKRQHLPSKLNPQHHTQVLPGVTFGVDGGL